MKFLGNNWWGNRQRKADGSGTSIPIQVFCRFDP